MILLLELILITSIWTLALTAASQPSMVLYRARVWAEQQGNWTDPIIKCYWCMPSLHSLISYGFAIGMELINGFSWSLIVIYPLVVCGASVLNGIVWSTITLLLKKIDYYDNLSNEEQEFQEGEGYYEEPNQTYYEKRN